MFCKLTIASLFTILATASPSPARPLLHYAAPSQRSRVAVSPSTLASKIELHAQVRQSNKAFYEDVTKDAAPVVLLWHDKLSRTALSQDWDYWASLSDEVRELSLVHPGVDQVPHQHTLKYGARGSDQITEDTRTVNKFQKRIYILRKMKLWKLDIFSRKLKLLARTKPGTRNPRWLEGFSPKLFSSDGEKAREEFIHSFVNKIKKSVLKYQSPIDFNKYTEYLIDQEKSIFPFLLETVNFLFKNNFINHETVRSIFQDNKTIWLVSRYNIHYIQERIVPQAQKDMTDITGQWFWQLKYPFLGALSDKERSMVNFKLLVDKLFQQGNSIKWKNEQKWQDFSKLFSMDIYANKLNPGNQPVEHVETLQVDSKLHIPQESKELFKLLAEIFLENWQDEKAPVSAICEVLDSIEKMYPGVMDILLEDRSIPNHFSHLHKSLLSDFRYYYLSKTSDEFLSIGKSSPDYLPGEDKIRKYYENSKIENKMLFQLEYIRLLEDTPNVFDQLEVFFHKKSTKEMKF